MNITSNRRFLLPAGKALVVLLTLYLLYEAIFTAPDTFLSWNMIMQNALSSSQRIFFIVSMLLIPVNWGFEAKKWQLLAQKVEPTTFSRAYRAVMVGLTLGFITPNRLGDYAGRVLELKSRQRLEAIGAVFIGRFCQLVATVLVGSLGLLYFIIQFYGSNYPAVAVSLTVLLVLLSCVMLLLLYNARVLVAVFAAVKVLRRFVPYVVIVASYSVTEISKLLLLSLGRYSIFMGQFILLLILFDVNLSLVQYVSGVSSTFLLKSIVPSISLISDLGVRELSAMYLFGLLGQERLQVLSASLSLWLLNIAVPSAVGLYFVLRLRLFSKGVKV